MARTNRKKKQADIPGSFYQRNGRWWWKVQLPGDKETKAFALKPYGSKFAATDLQVAREVARNLYQQAIFKSDKSPSIDSITNVGELFKAYLEYAKTYYRNPEGKVTSEPANISYAMELVIQYYGNLSLDEFGPLKLLELRKDDPEGLVTPNNQSPGWDDQAHIQMGRFAADCLASHIPGS